LIGIVQAAKEDPAQPRYLVVANVKEICANTEIALPPG
jgi:hypothetical protein